MEVAEKFNISLTTKEESLKKGVGFVVKAALVDLGILVSESERRLSAIVDQDQGEKNVSARTALPLTFEQQKQLLLLEVEKSRISQEVELHKFDTEAQRFALIREGKLGYNTGSLQAPIVSPAPKAFDIAHALNLMPKSDEDNLDT